MGESASPYTLVRYQPAYRTRWNAFARAHGTVFHSLEWKEALEETFGYRDLYSVVVDDRDTLVGLLPLFAVRNLSLRRVAVSVPFAAHVDICCAGSGVRQFLLEQLPALLRRDGLGRVELRLSDPVPLEAPASLNTDNFTFRLALGADDDSLLARASPDVRRRARLAYVEKRFTSSSDWGRLEEFYQIYRKRQRELGSPAPGIALFQRIRDKLPENITLLTVLDADVGRVLGGMFLLADRDTVYYLWGAAERAYNRHHINHFMYLEATALARRQGYLFLDMGRSPKGPPHAGSYSFKVQFGAEPVQLHYYRIGDSMAARWHNEQERLRPFIALWQHLPVSVTDLVGKQLIKYVAP